MAFFETSHESLRCGFILLEGLDIVFELLELQVGLGDSLFFIFDGTIELLQLVIEPGERRSFLLESPERISVLGLNGYTPNKSKRLIVEQNTSRHLILLKFLHKFF